MKGGEPKVVDYFLSKRGKGERDLSEKISGSASRTSAL